MNELANYSNMAGEFERMRKRSGGKVKLWKGREGGRNRVRKEGRGARRETDAAGG